MANSRAGSVPPTAFRMEAKLLSVAYQPSSGGFVSCHSATPPSSIFPHFSSAEHTDPCAPFTLKFLPSARHTVYATLLCSSVSLPFTPTLHYVFHVLPCFCAQEGIAGPWESCPCGISTVKPSWPSHGSPDSFCCFPLSCWSPTLYWNGLYVWRFHWILWSSKSRS